MAWSSTASGGFTKGFTGPGGHVGGTGNWSGGGVSQTRGGSGDSKGGPGNFVPNSRPTLSIKRKPTPRRENPAPEPPPLLPATRSFNNGVMDVSIIPYMRHIEIDFVATGLRPNRRVWFFFDDTDITKYISEANELELTSNGSTVVTVNSTNSVINSATLITEPDRPINLNDNGRSEQITQEGNTNNRINRVLVYCWRRKPNDDRENTVIKYSSRAFFGNLSPGMKWTGRESGANGIIKNHFVKCATVKGANNSWITLNRNMRHVPNNWWGTDNSNSIFIVSGNKRWGKVGEHRPIMGWNNVSLRLALGTTFNTAPVVMPPIGQLGPIEEMPSIVLPNTTITIGKTDLIDNSGVAFYTDNEGNISGTFHVPEGTFRTGERVFKIIDNNTGIDADATTYAKYTFAAEGLKTTTQEVTITIDPVVTRRPTPSTPPRTPTRPPVRRDPVAQTFFVEEADYPEGVFLSSVDLWFRNKDPSMPVTIEIRPTVNGFPSSYDVVPGGTVVKFPQDVVISDNPTFESDLNFTMIYRPGWAPPKTNDIFAGKTNFKFKDPVYLVPGEYALVVISDSREYEVWVSELGQKVVNTGQIVSEQPYIGSLFKSQNATTWTPTQMEDLMFALNKAVFPTNTRGLVYMNSDRAAANTNADSIIVKVESTPVAPSANIAYELADNYLTNFYSIAKDTPLFPDSKQREIVTDAGPGYFNVKSILTTTNRDVSPIIFRDRNTIVIYENHIDDAGLDSRDIVITNPGSGSYVPNANIVLTITSNTGIGAEGFALANTSNSRGVDVIVITNPGYGYTDDSTVVRLKSGDANAVGTGQTFSVISETSPSGGSVLAKYISRVATLNEGFDSSDIRVYITAYKPATADIKVFYKVKNSNDPDKFDDKNFVEMAQKTPLSVYSEGDEVIEYEFEPKDYPNPITYSTDSATFRTFNQFQIKIALTSSNPTDPPVLRDMRAIALPEQEF